MPSESRPMTREQLADAVLGWAVVTALGAVVWLAVFLIAARVVGS